MYMSSSLITVYDFILFTVCKFTKLIVVSLNGPFFVYFYSLHSPASGIVPLPKPDVLRWLCLLHILEQQIFDTFTVSKIVV